MMGLSFLPKKKPITRIVGIIIMMVSIGILTIIQIPIFTDRSYFTWPLFPWLLLPLSGYLLCSIIPNQKDYNKNDRFSRPGKRPLAIFTVALPLLLLYPYRYVQGLPEVLFKLSFVLIVYGIFDVIFFIIKHLDFLKIFSKYSVTIWYLHLAVIISLIGVVRLTDLYSYLLFLTIFTLGIYTLFKLFDFIEKKKVKGFAVFINLLNTRPIFITIDCLGLYIFFLFVARLELTVFSVNPYYAIALAFQLICVEALRRVKRV
jgi:hypothetical protein